MQEWEEVVLEVFTIGREWRAEMLKAAGETLVNKLCEVIQKTLPDNDVEGCRRELMEKMSERWGRLGVTPNDSRLQEAATTREAGGG